MDTSITKIVNGKTYTAERVITGTNKIRQVITFMGHKEHDSKTYGPKDIGEMDAMADLILWQLVTIGWPGQSPLEPKQ